MVRCSNPECQNGSWFHYDCVGITSAPDDFDWWCSDDCRSTGSSAVCRCNQVRTGSPLVICANANCNKGATFHMSCVGLKELPGHNFFLCCDRFHFYYTPYSLLGQFYFAHERCVQCCFEYSTRHMYYIISGEIPTKFCSMIITEQKVLIESCKLGQSLLSLIALLLV